MTEMHDSRPLPRTDALAYETEPCSNCGAPLARDQRYCLACGDRRAGFPAVLSGLQSDPASRAIGPTASAEPDIVTTTYTAPPPTLASRTLNAGVAGGVACLLLALLVGVLIGRAGNDNPPPTAAAPSVVTVGGTGAAATGSGATAGTPAAFTSDWPEGKRGFTVQLQTLAKEGTDAAAVATAKQAAVTSGAQNAGALDSDLYATLDPGQYVIFSGQFADRGAARKELSKLKKAFPDAKVVEVASDKDPASASTTKDSNQASGKTKEPSKAEQAKGAKAIQDLDKASPEEYQKKSAKLPKTIVTPGKPPPKDSKPAGGGSGGGQTFE
ncbi:MAG: hypothetical protein H0V22_00465 [Solirubrobacterales bacterium]|jgi:hypothetical protein|nr:hypothetical protein [Solirubrobacterales bacterium]